MKEGSHLQYLWPTKWPGISWLRISYMAFISTDRRHAIITVKLSGIFPFPSTLTQALPQLLKSCIDLKIVNDPSFQNCIKNITLRLLILYLVSSRRCWIASLWILYLEYLPSVFSDKLEETWKTKTGFKIGKWKNNQCLKIRARKYWSTEK